MSKYPLVTICVPTIGRTAMLQETLISIYLQTSKNYEVLILDNASPADAQEVIHSYVNDEPRARVLRSAKRLHMFENFSRGIQAANGKYLTFFHDDDVYLPEFIRHHVSLLEANAHAGFSGSNCFVIDGLGHTIGKRDLIRKNDVCSGKRYIAALMGMGVNLFPMQSIMFRASVLGPDTFNKSLEVNFSDFVILMRIAEKHNVGLIARPLMKMRNHQGQVSQGMKRREAIRLRTRLLSHYCSEFAVRWPNERNFVRKLEQKVNRSRQTGLLWGWISSRTETESRDCLLDLNKSPIEVGIRGLLTQVEEQGLSWARRQKFLMPYLRKIGYLIGKGGLV